MARVKLRAEMTARADYEADFFAWTQEQAQLLRDRDARGLDWENLAEEIDSMGRRGPPRAGKPASRDPASSSEVASPTRAARSQLAEHPA
jgi:hypothetical protein